MVGGVARCHREGKDAVSRTPPPERTVSPGVSERKPRDMTTSLSLFHREDDWSTLGGRALTAFSHVLSYGRVPCTEEVWQAAVKPSLDTPQGRLTRIQRGLEISNTRISHAFALVCPRAASKAGGNLPGT
jgi:hypothetical protein